jgi:hypothetical protein
MEIFCYKNLKQTKMLWTFEWSKMGHIFISPYHNHDFGGFHFLKTYMLKGCVKWPFFVCTFKFINHITSTNCGSNPLS